MRMQWIPLIILIIICILLDIYNYRRIKGNNYSKAYLCVIFILYCCLSAVISINERETSNTGLLIKMWGLYIFFSIYISRIVTASIRSIKRLFDKKYSKLIVYSATTVGIILFSILMYSAFVTRFKVDIRRVDITTPKLPPSFDNIKIVQISDFHIGTYGTDTSFVSLVVDTINSIKPDLILFTGDIVNRESKELIPFLNTLKKLKCKYGVFSVLGNHDYGDYKDWNTQKDKECNMKILKAYMKNIGWNLLNNDYSILKSKRDSIIIIGVENWGDSPFKTYADLKKSYTNINDQNFKILLSHNPMQWNAEVVNNTNIDLTLSGHTHAMQIEFNIAGKSYSPAYLRYREWGGLYKNKEQYLYVNIGLGAVGLPYRIGATPEITILNLKRQ